MQLRHEFVSLAKAHLAWGNYKRAARYTLVGQGLALKTGAIWMSTIHV
jgi:hypothetical protein